MSRETNIAVFEDTERFCGTNSSIIKRIEDARAGQTIYPENGTVQGVSLDRYAEEANVLVSGKRTFEAASVYKDRNVAVLNFASATHPGGGVVNGSNAQEECLCRCSDLYFCLNTRPMWDGFYNPHRAEHNPLHNDDIIYTPGITVFKTDTAIPEIMPARMWYDVNVITCAAPNLKSNPQKKDEPYPISDKDLYDLHVKRFKRILEVVSAEGNEAVILGAFGCGAFRNDPKVVAEAAYTATREFLHAFRTIEFAVYCRRGAENENYNAFSKVFQKAQAKKDIL